MTATAADIADAFEALFGHPLPTEVTYLPDPPDWQIQALEDRAYASPEECDQAAERYFNR